MINCKYFKTRKHDNKKEKRIYYYCTLLRKEILLSQCQQCDKKEYKSSGFKKKSPVKNGLQRSAENCRGLKQRTYKQAKKERNRYSLFTDDLEHCIICGQPNVNLHEIFGGRNRSNSIKYGLVIPLCTKRHHNQIEKKGIHFDNVLKDEWHKKGQTMFNQVYPGLDFTDIFFRNYL